MGNINFTSCNISIYYSLLKLRHYIILNMKKTKSSNFDKRWESNFYQRSIPCTKSIILVFMTILLLSLCTSCIHDNSWNFRVKNQTEDTLVLTTEAIIPDFRVQVHNYDYLESEPRPEVYNIRYINVSDTIFVLPPSTEFDAWKAWSSHDVLSDNPESDGVTPSWKFIKRMELGGAIIIIGNLEFGAKVENNMGI